MASKGISAHTGTTSQSRSRFLAGRSKILSLGFAGAVALISLAGAYAIYGGTTGKQFDTGNSNSYRPEAGSGTTQKEPQQMVTTDGSANSSQPGSDGAANSNQSSTTVTVNGKKVEVPANGSYSQTVDENGTHTEIKANSNHSSSTSGNSSNNSSSSSVNINISSGGSSQ